jgi:hypothetical protein
LPPFLITLYVFEKWAVSALFHETAHPRGHFLLEFPCADAGGSLFIFGGRALVFLLAGVTGKWCRPHVRPVMFFGEIQPEAY